MNERGLIYSQGAISGSKSTIISIVPFPIDEFKPGLIPGHFHVDAKKGDDPVCTVIGDSFFYVYIDADRGNLRVPAPSYHVCRSICFDYLTAQLEANEDCHPGLFWKDGIWTPERVRKEAADELAHFERCQYNWFKALVMRADDDWEKTRTHYAISDTQRHALRAIDPENKAGRPWIVKNFEESRVIAENTITCPSCGSDLIASAVICRYCHLIIDQVRYNQMSFAKPHTSASGVNLNEVM